MKCPNCGQEMELGEVLGTRAGGVIWFPKRLNMNKKLFGSVSGRFIEENGAVFLSDPNYGLERPSLDVYYCRKCKIGQFHL